MTKNSLDAFLLKLRSCTDLKAQTSEHCGEVAEIAAAPQDGLMAEDISKNRLIGGLFTYLAVQVVLEVHCNLLLCSL